MALAQRERLEPEQFVAFAPDDISRTISYASELLTHDGAIASLVACAAACTASAVESTVLGTAH